MKVKELIKELQRYPADAEVLLEYTRRVNMRWIPVRDEVDFVHRNEGKEVIIMALHDWI